MKPICSWLYFTLTILATLVVLVPPDSHADIIRQDDELAPSAPKYTRNQMGKQLEAEVILNVNVPDGQNPGKMKSIPVTIKLDPTKVTTPEEKAKAIADAINNNDAIKSNNEDLKKNKRGREQVSASASKDTKQAPLYDFLGRPILDPKTRRQKTGPVMEWQVHTRNTVADNGPGTTPHQAHPVTYLTDTSNEPHHSLSGKPGVKPPAGGGTPSPGTKGTMSGKGLSATGFHPDSTPADPIESWVTFGYFPNRPDADAEVFTVYPDPGQSDSDILMELALGLNSLGIPASYDLSTNTLTLDVELASNQGFWFGDTDPGLDFEVGFPMVTMVIPEPATIALLSMTGLALLLHVRARRT